jgi:hypothetical protein
VESGNNESIIAQILVRNADSLRFVRLDVALRKINRRKMVRNAVRMEGGLAMYSVYMGMDERRKELCQRKQE